METGTATEVGATTEVGGFSWNMSCPQASLSGVGAAKVVEAERARVISESWNCIFINFKKLL